VADFLVVRGNSPVSTKVNCPPTGSAIWAVTANKELVLIEEIGGELGSGQKRRRQRKRRFGWFAESPLLHVSVAIFPCLV
jgi:hypothetical protein